MSEMIDFMKLANNLGKEALGRGDYPCGCVIVKNNEIVSQNSSRSVTKIDSTAHAEINAISEACKKLKTRDLSDCELYTNIEPCLMCGKAIVYSKIKKVVFGTEHKEYGNKKTFGILRENNVGNDIEVVSGIDKEEAEKLLDEWSSK